MEELARASAAVMVGLSVHNSLCCRAVLDWGSDTLKDRYLPRMATGELMGSYCLSEPGSGTDAGSLSCLAEDRGDHFLLNGTKAWVTSAGLSSIYIVFVLTDKKLGSKGISCIIVEKGTPGMTLGIREKKMGLKSSDTRQVMFTDCAVPKDNLIGERNNGFKIALSLINGGRVGIAAQAVGIAQAAFEEAYKYAHQRIQFGQPIANFQAIQFKLADMATKIEAARLLTYSAAWKKDRLGKEAALYCSIAKLFASEAANWIVNQALQIHGGYGYVKEYAVERHFRDARIIEIYEGTSEAQRMVIFRNLGKK
jgi:alkylation response protein AidB-like acyl-CoA dehydrogenase